MRYFLPNGVEVPDPGVRVSIDVDDEDYTSSPTWLRVYEEGDEDFPWMLDGFSRDGGYTEDVRTFRTLEEALAFIPDFVQSNIDTLTWEP